MTPGTRLGPYEIVEPIGAGGMGEVYKARDTRLDRTVAVKVLPSHIAAREDLRGRFEREARAVSSLKHPHICTLYDVGKQDGVDFLVMEHLEGETLADRVERGPLPLEQAMKYAMQIADAVDRAHRSGVVHRDLKPANIMLTRDGVKVLDFGLAKTAPVNAAAASGVTLTQALTTEGTLLGTPQYMAPEQIEGSEADARTDIFAFGCVVYEMVTGRRAFDGKTRTSIIGAILSAEPPAMTVLQPVTPATLDYAVRRCLAKDPEERWQSLKDVLLLLQAPVEARAVPDAPVSILRRCFWAGGALVLLVAVAAGGWLVRTPEAKRNFQVALEPPPDTAFVFTSTNAGGFALSPDGSTIAFVGRSKGRAQLWVRRLNEMAARPLAGTDRAHRPFWSPDGRSIGFFADGKLKRIDIAGGSPQVLAETGAGRGGTWNADNIILFCGTAADRVIRRIAATGGPATALTTLDNALNERGHYWPWFLPDGRHFLYATRALEGGSVYLASLDAPDKRKLVVKDGAQAIFAQSHLLYITDRTVMAQKFDAKRLETAGEPFRVADDVALVVNIGAGAFTASDNGLLAWGNVAGAERMGWRDRTGKAIGLSNPPPATLVSPALSPDGKSLAYGRVAPGGGLDLWVLDMQRSAHSRFTFGPESAVGPVWSPDGGQIAFTSGAGAAILRKPTNRASEPVAVLSRTPEVSWIARDWSPDGRYLVVVGQKSAGGSVLAAFPMEGSSSRPTTLVESKFSLQRPRVSPDGRWIAYDSDESTIREVYVQAFNPAQPGAVARRQISATGGYDVRWRRDGREIFYISAAGQMTSVPVKWQGNDYELGSPASLFAVQAIYQPAGVWTYDVTADGQRFAIVEDADDSGVPMHVSINWLEGARK